LNDIGGVGNEAECEIIIYNKKIENEDEKDSNEKEVKTSFKKINKDKNLKINSNNKNNKLRKYDKNDDVRNYYCTYLFLRGTVPIKMKMELESIFDKPKIIMFLSLFIVFLIKTENKIKIFNFC
jgi:hypothetical protein